MKITEIDEPAMHMLSLLIDTTTLLFYQPLVAELS